MSREALWPIIVYWQIFNNSNMLDFEWNFFGEKTSTIWSIVHSRCLEEHFQKKVFWKKYKNINLFVIPANSFFTMMRNLLRQLFRTKFFSWIFVSFFPLFLSETLGEKIISGKKLFFLTFWHWAMFYWLWRKLPAVKAAFCLPKLTFTEKNTVDFVG